MLSKQALREKIWQRLMLKEVTRFPGAHGRIPNFKGAEQAARQLFQLDVWQKAGTVKSNPDSPQRYVRYAALRDGKIVYQAVPRLRQKKPFIELDPRRLDESVLWGASSIKGAFAKGRPVDIEEMPAIDLIVAGSVAVSHDGTRLGKGGGYSDLEYALCREAELVHADTPIVTTVHSLQIVPEGQIQMMEHDIPVNYFATPDEVVQTDFPYPRPSGIFWEKLGDKLGEIPVLQKLRKEREIQS